MTRGDEAKKVEGEPEVVLALKGRTARYSDIDIVFGSGEDGLAHQRKRIRDASGREIPELECRNDIDFVSLWIAWLLLGGKYEKQNEKKMEEKEGDTYEQRRIYESRQK